jgi:hypothetical protein
MAVEVFTSFEQITDSDGAIVSGAEVSVYDVGTTTLKTVYDDPALGGGDTAANPIICDAAGRHDMRYIATGSYKVVIRRTGAGATVLTRDNIDGRVPVGSGALAIANGGTGSTTAEAALAALGGATAAELADVAADVASLQGTLASTERTHLATGTTAQRPASPIEGDVRRNTTTTAYEGHNGTDWLKFVQLDSGGLLNFSGGTTTFTAGGIANSALATPPPTLLATLTASASASLADTTSFTSTYTRYRLVIENLVPATDAQDFEFKYNVGGVQSTNYLSTRLVATEAATVSGESTTHIKISGATTVDNTAANGGVCGELTIWNPASTTTKKLLTGQTFHINDAGTHMLACTISGIWTGSNAAVTGFQVAASSGNITSGTIKIYGLK